MSADLSHPDKDLTTLQLTPTAAGERFYYAQVAPTTSSMFTTATGGTSLDGGRDDGGRGDSEHMITFTFTESSVSERLSNLSDPPRWIPFKRANLNVTIVGMTFVDVSRPLTPLMDVNTTNPQGVVFDASPSSIAGSVTVNLTAIVNKRNLVGNPLVVGINWTVHGGGLEGITYTPAFAYINDQEDADSRRKIGAAINESSYRWSREVRNDTADRGSTPSPLPTSGTDSNNTNGTSSLLSGGRGDGATTGGGLSTGAIVGIAVGVGVAALLAAALGIFFFLRRRRRLEAGGGPSSLAARRDHTRAAEQEKLSAFPKDGGGSSSLAGGNASDAAIAPYRDDATTPTTNRDRRRSSAAREDVAPAPAPVDRDSRAGSLTTQQQQNGVSRHLVEDGMTADEIRRLEEEEAHLDNEIQRAGGRRV